MYDDSDDLFKRVEQCESLEDLFDLWRKSHSDEKDYLLTTVDGMEKNSFVSDGYIHKDKYLKSKYKVLFVMKEANILNYKDGYNVDSDKREQINFYRNYIISEKALNRTKQQEKIGRMACFLLHNNKIPDKQDINDSLSMCAFMNLNKRGGDKSAVKEKFNKYINEYKQFIQREIEILNPDCIVMLGTNCGEKFIYEFALKHKIRYLGMWHTAYRMSGVKRSDDARYSFGDKNVDCYMRKFFDICREKVWNKS